MPLLELDVESTNLIDDLQSGEDCAIGIVFVRNGIAEISHEAIAHVLGVIPFIVVDDFLRDAMKISDGIAKILRIHPASQRGGVDQVAAQQGHLPSDRGLVGTAARGNSIAYRNLRAVSQRRRHRGTAAVAELGSWRDCAATSGARHTNQERTAASTEPGAVPVLDSARGTPHGG